MPPHDAVSDPVRATLPRLLAAFAGLYLIWGSTYLAIRFAIETLPPFTMAGVRFTVAGAILYLWSRRLRGWEPPTAAQWRAAAVVGGLLLLGGNGAVVWAEQFVASGLAALLVATVPLWMVLLDWLAGGARPTPGVVLGLLVGLGGVALLVTGDGMGGADRSALLGGVAVLGGAFLWAAGSIYSRSADLPSSLRLGSAMQMLTGGAMLLGTGAAFGEWSEVDPTAVSTRSALSLAYLVVFGSLIAFSAYIWLLRASTPARVSTYAYVNPVVALVLGWALADEPITPRIVLAAAIVLAAVVAINLLGGRRRRRPVPSSGPPSTSTRP